MRAELAVLAEDDNYLQQSRHLADKLERPLLAVADAKQQDIPFFLVYRDHCLKLLDKALLKKGGLTVNIDPRPGEQSSYPASKKGALAQAVGRKTQTILDATTGWAQDSLALFRMGYHMTCLERSPVMVALIEDGFSRLAQKDWVIRRQLQVPELISGNSIDRLQNLASQPDCIYLDPMFPPKRKKSALAKKGMNVLRDILGDDTDKQQLFMTAMQHAGKRVVVKSPDDAEPLGGQPSMSYASKLVRYDVYLIGENQNV